jgi:sugar phosphate isomerase/epimerase
MHLAFSSNAFTRFTLDDAIREIADAGYVGIEILCDTPHAVPEALEPRRIGYRGFITVEVYPRSDKPAEAACESMEHLRGLDLQS